MYDVPHEPEFCRRAMGEKKHWINQDNKELWADAQS
jgi:hypothetical protein